MSSNKSRAAQMAEARLKNVQKAATNVRRKRNFPLDNMKLTGSGMWSMLPQQYTDLERANKLAEEIDRLDKSGQGNSHQRFTTWNEYRNLHDKLVESGKYTFDDATGFWSCDEDDDSDNKPSMWDPTPYTWEYPEGKSGAAPATAAHVCEFVDVGFHFSKLVCKICGEEKKS